MQVLARWRNVLMKNTITQSATPSNNHLGLFHSTDASFEKWKTKFNFDVRGDKQPPSKDYIRYSVREKRANTKKALKNLLFNGGSSTSRFEDSFSKIEADYSDRMNKKSRMKPARQAKKAHHKKMKSKHKREKIYEEFDGHERIFQANFGDQCFTWSFKPWEKGFDWRGTYFSSKEENHPRNGAEFDSIVGTFADRRILGLPPAGPLRIEDVKAAFRLSALKWHPDKHQGSSQGEAEEKFKQCVNAYKSLCSALSPPP
ncbi:hypothetical protein ACJIZ3_016541 [Penstemon smallii]|uniref:J domain-containing protein n=1 Tax=Penstemon smallii TaxID=265156 RepID=A0ABD3SSZ9_9LAMI